MIAIFCIGCMAIAQTHEKVAWSIFGIGCVAYSFGGIFGYID